MVQGVVCVYQYWGGGYGVCQYIGGEFDILVEYFIQYYGDQYCVVDYYQCQYQVVFFVVEKNRKKVGFGFYVNVKNKQYKVEIKGIGVNCEMLLV